MASLENVWGAGNGQNQRVNLDRFSAEAFARTLPDGRVFIPDQEAFLKAHEENEDWLSKAEKRGGVNQESIRRIRADLAYTKSLAERGTFGYIPKR